MAVSQTIIDSVKSLDTKISSLYNRAKNIAAIKDKYVAFFSKWSIFKGSINRHSNESANPLLKSFYDQYMEYKSYVDEKEAFDEGQKEKEAARAKARKEIPLTPSKSSGIGLAALIGIPLAALFFFIRKK